MMDLTRLTTTGETVSSRAFAINDRLVLELSGDASLQAVDQIDRLLGELHQLAGRHKLSSVAVDFRKLEFMNSSCFKKFVRWVMLVAEMETDQYRISLVSDPESFWQRRAMHALQAFAVHLITIES